MSEKKGGPLYPPPTIFIDPHFAQIRKNKNPKKWVINVNNFNNSYFKYKPLFFFFFFSLKKLGRWAKNYRTRPDKRRSTAAVRMVCTVIGECEY